MISWFAWRSGVGFDAELLTETMVNDIGDEIEFSGLIIRLPLIEIALGVVSE